ncbi:hypothetical protein H4R35_001775 [Dimargaris xerosporica]|nr:hypothetical protein H4R35_001775 [Dimargaris xerosporica]
MRHTNSPPERRLNQIQWRLGIVQAILAAVVLALTLAEVSTMITVLSTTRRRGHFGGTLPFFLITHALALVVAMALAVGGVHYGRLSLAEQYALTYYPTDLARTTQKDEHWSKSPTKPLHDEIAWHASHATASRFPGHGLWQGGLQRCAHGFRPHMCLGLQLVLFGLLVGAAAVFNTSTAMLGATCSQFQSKWWLFSLCHMDRLNGILMMLECAVWAVAVGIAVSRVVQQSRTVAGQVAWRHFCRPPVPQSDHASECRGSMRSTLASASPTLCDAGLETMSPAKPPATLDTSQDQVQWLTAAVPKCPLARPPPQPRTPLPADSGDESEDEGAQICSLKEQTVQIASAVQRVHSIHAVLAKVTTAKELSRSAS